MGLQYCVSDITGIHARWVYVCVVEVHVHLTEAGQTLLHSAPTALQQEFVNRFNALPDWEQSMILASLQRIAHMMNAQDIDASPFLDTGELDRQI